MSQYQITLDKEREFRYGMRAIDYIEKHKLFKKPIAKIDMENLTMDETAVVLLAGLRHEDKELTTDKVIDLVDEHSSYGAVVKVAIKALTVAMIGEEDYKKMEEEFANLGQPAKN